jgi:hypothetical protein
MGSIVKTGAVLFVKDLEKVASFYERVAKLRRISTAQDHVVLKSGGYKLVVHAFPADVAPAMDVDTPVAVREDCRLKLVFSTASISTARKSAVRLGGLVKGREYEWRYQSEMVCDGCDPEGNVVQFRQRRDAGNPPKKEGVRKSKRAARRS